MSELVTQLGVGAAVALLVIDKSFSFIKGFNGKRNGKDLAIRVACIETTCHERTKFIQLSLKRIEDKVNELAKPTKPAA